MMMVAEKKKEQEFLIELISFYNKSLGNTADAVLTLKELQERFPDEYKELVDLQEDPSVLLKMTDKMDSDVSKVLFELMIKAANLSNKMSKLFDLTIEEKNNLATDLKKFSQDMSENVKQLKQKS